MTINTDIHTSGETISFFWSEVEDNYPKLINITKKMLVNKTVKGHSVEDILNSSLEVAANNILDNGFTGSTFMGYINNTIRLRIFNINNMKQRGKHRVMCFETPLNKFEYDYEKERRKAIFKQNFFDYSVEILKNHSRKTGEITPLDIQIFRFYYLGKLSYAKISSKMNYSIRFISEKVNKCRDVLKKELDKEIMEEVF